jgi:hypothetical protein
MDRIKERTKLISSNIDDALKWAKKQDDEVIQSSLENALLTQKRSLITVERALNKRPSIAVFGQSQVGKSYLIQNLAKPDDEKFLKIYAGDKNPLINFLTEMNPDGGQESTGLVTRFTTKKTNVNPSYPFQIELFTQLDIACVLINSYWSDLKDYEESINDDDIQKAKISLENLVIGEAFNDITEYDTFNFINYVLKNFKDVYLIRDLNKIGYFRHLYTTLSYIKCEERWRFLEILWGNNKFITEIFKLLSENIANLKFSNNLSLPLDALSPNTTTILDVERVRELFEYKARSINVLINESETKSINLSILSILTKEVNLQIANSFTQKGDRNFMLHSDLLDFPGSKSREKIPLTVFNNNTSEQKLQLLIRGKVSYLFDTYTNSLGVATLIYCMDDSPPEEKEAPSRLYKWISKYVGENKNERNKKLNKSRELVNKKGNISDHLSPLLIALTKFNVEINKVIPGKETNIESHDSKWNARIKENFINFMSRPVDDKWIINWTDDQQNFNFVFPIRDPLYSQATFEGFETDGKETKIRPERQDAMNSIGISFKGSNYVQKHIMEPQEIWNELSSPNGSGVKHFSKYLNQCSDPILSDTRFNFELDRINKNVKSVLKPHVISGNLDEDLRVALKESSVAFTSIISLANRKDNILQKLLKNILISDTEIWQLIYDNIFKMQSLKENDANNLDINIKQSFEDLGININNNSTKDEILDGLKEIYDGLSLKEIRDIIMEFINFDINNIDDLLFHGKTDTEDNLADEIIKYWVNKCINFLINDDLIKKLSENQEEAFKSLINEILKSRERLGLKKEIEDILDYVQTGTISNLDIDLVASCSSKILNRFILSAGWFMSEEQYKPTLPNYQHPIFSEFAKDYNIDSLNYKQKINTRIFFKEWSFGCRKIFEENVRYDYGLSGKNNVSSNSVLKNILESLNNDKVLSE